MQRNLCFLDSLEQNKGVAVFLGVSLCSIYGGGGREEGREEREREREREREIFPCVLVFSLLINQGRLLKVLLKKWRRRRRRRRRRN